MIIKNNLRYDQHGRKRKSKTTKAVKAPAQEWKTFAPEPTYRRTTKEYPSAPMSQYTPARDSSYKKEATKCMTDSRTLTKNTQEN